MWAELSQQYPLLSILLSPLSFVVRPDTRVFWPFLLSSLIFASWWRVYFHKHYSQALNSKGQARSVFLDFVLLFSNQWFRLLVFVPIIVSQMAVTLWVVRSLYFIFDGRLDWQINAYFLIALFTLVSFMADDFSRFYLHRFLHKNKFLWQFHQLHHSAKALTPFTLYRIHPLEMLLFMLRGIIVLGLCAGIFSYCFKGQISGWHILGVNIIGFIFNASLANLRHSSIRLGFGLFEKAFISPAQHQIHHQNHKTDFSSNYGSCLAIWDRIFNSWQSSRKNEIKAVGLRGIEHNNLLAAWFIPFKNSWILLKRYF